KSIVVTEERKTKVEQKKTKTVLDEDTYTEKITDIIQRDFFPDLSKLEAQAEYLEALEKNDLVTLRKIQMKYGPVMFLSSFILIDYTPATFETPDPSHRPHSPSSKPSNDKAPVSTTNIDVQKKSKMGLDKFLSKNTSEDNASFNEILEESDKKHRMKHAWLFNKEDEQMKEHTDKLALPSIEEQAVLAIDKSSVDTWKYQAKNAVMYVPEGKDRISEKKFKAQEIVHENTRFYANPHDMKKNKQIMQQAAVNKALSNQGKIGHDGKELTANQTPKINGYGFVATPSPAPGVEESPLMTWGEIEGTPLTLDTGVTPGNTSGPVFKIPNIPQRDQIAMELAEKASKNHRAKKQAALQQVSRNLASPSPKFSLSSTDRLNSLSPAAQRLASKKLGIRTHTDKALKDSYTPSPSHRLPGDKTPVRLTPLSSPNSVRSSIQSSPRTPRTPIGKHTGSDIRSLTDNLLQLPKRPK
ncbi:hypothetical protein LOTGIDRAFT_72520, partial [Lottia gigantea]